MSKGKGHEKLKRHEKVLSVFVKKRGKKRS